MQFNYVAYDASGTVVRGAVSAESQARAEEMLGTTNITVVSLRRGYRVPPLEEAIPTIFGVKRQDLIAFTRDLASLMEAGIPLLRAMGMLAGQAQKRAMRSVILRMKDDLETGQLFSQACARHPRVFPPLYLRLVQIGEEIGDLGLMLRQLTGHLEKEAALIEKITRSLAYPAFVLLMGVVSVFILVLLVLPAMSGLLQEFGANLPLATRMVIAITDFLREFAPYVIIGLVVVAAAGWRYRATARGRRQWDSLLLKTPVVGDVVLKSAVSRIARTTHVLLDAGVSLTDTLNLLVQTTENQALRQTLVGVRDRVHEGQPLSRAMTCSPLFPAMMCEMVTVGEETGTISSNMNMLATFYEAGMDRSISRLTGMLGPGLVLLVGGMVGFIAVSVLSPMYSIIEQIK